MPSTATDSSSTLRPHVWFGLAAVCAYLLAFRVYDLADNYPMLGEQIRDWSIAQRRFGDLPLIGPRSLNSGLDIGPAYYWVLWAGRVLLTPLIGPLPHTGGWVVAVFATIGDGVLLAALWRRLQSFWLAAAIVAFAATAAGDASLSAVVWNPPIAETFAKLAMATVLWPGRTTLLRSLATLLLAIGATQCHSSGVLIAVPLVSWTLWILARERGARAVTTVLLVAALSLGAWASTYVGRPPAPPAVGGAHIGVVDSLAALAADPLTRLRPLESARAVSTALQSIFTLPFDTPWFGVWLSIGIVVAIVMLRNGALVAVSVVPLLMAIAAFSLWQGPFGETYWFLVIVPAAAVCLASPAVALSGRLRQVAVLALVALTVALQIPRSRHIRTYHRLPAYGPLAKGVDAAVISGIAVRGITPAFAVPEGMDALFIFSQAGGRLDRAAPVTLLIRTDGSIEYVAAR